MKQCLMFFLIFISFILIGQNDRPNIIVFLVDDMGWQDCSVPFHTEKTKWNNVYRTPNMEKLAKEGIKFTNAYASAVCSPTRVSIMTGMNPIRHKVTNWTLRKNQSNDAKSEILAPPAWNVNGLSAAPNIENTVYATPLPEILRNNGYMTIHVGKAHFVAAGTPGSDPLNLGFDINIAGHAAGAPKSYFGQQNFGQNMQGDSIWAVPHLEKYWGKDMFLTEALTIEAMNSMTKAKEANKPFFLHLSHYAVHTPIMADNRFVQNYYDMDMDSIEAKYASLIEGMDKSLGDIMQYLKNNNLDQNTIIFFLSDNGGLSAVARGGEKHQHNTPLRSGKGSVYEGGVRIPFIVKWPNKIKPNTVSQEKITVEDIFPTVLAMTNIKKYKKIQKIDGLDFTPIFNEKKLPKNRYLYWHYPHKWGPKGQDLEFYSAIRQGEWKLIYFHIDNKFELYNTLNDISEQHNLIETERKMSGYLIKQLKKFLKENQTEMPTFLATNKKVVFP